MNPHYFVGVDGGGTKTEFVCIDADGRIVARSRTGPTYHVQVGVEGVEQALASGFAAICAQLAVEPSALTNVFIGLPAFGEDDRIDPLLDAACARILGGKRYECGNDMICGWAGSLGCQDGINLVAGTGSIGYGRRGDRDGRVGGWGEIFSDEGSAYCIAVQGLNAFTRMSDGRLPKGPLHAAFFDALGLSSDLEVCARVLGDHGMGRDGIAGLAPIVSHAADHGDHAAATILDAAAAELAQMATALRARLGYHAGEPAKISWSGGVLAQAHQVRDGLRDLLQPGDDFEIVTPLWDPATGAANYARHCSRRDPAELR